MATTKKTIMPAAQSWEFDGASWIDAGSGAHIWLQGTGFATGGWLKLDSNAGGERQTFYDSGKDLGLNMEITMAVIEDTSGIIPYRKCILLDGEGAAGVFSLISSAIFTGDPGWVHVILSTDGPNDLNFYINGVLDTPKSVSGTFTTYVPMGAQKLIFGRDELGTTDYVNAGNRMCHWFSLDRHLTAQERADLSDGSAPSTPGEVFGGDPDLLFWFSGSNFRDEGPSEVTLTNHGITLAADAPTGIATVGDYTSLAAWEAARGGVGAGDEVAECYGGGDLGSCVIWNSGWDDEARNILICAAAGEAPYINGDAGIHQSMGWVDGAWITIEDLALNLSSGYCFKGTDAMTRMRINRCVGLNDTMSVFVYHNSTGVNNRFVITNCLYKNSATTNQIFLTQTFGDLTLTMYNCTFIGCTGNAVHIQNSIGAATVTAILKNNIVVDSTLACYWMVGAIGTSGCSNNLDDGDGSADAQLGGADNVSEADEDNIFADYANDDFHLMAGSVALDSGAQVAGYGTAQDLDEVFRPLGSGYDMGCYEWTPPDIGGGAIAASIALLKSQGLGLDL